MFSFFLKFLRNAVHKITRSIKSAQHNDPIERMDQRAVFNARKGRIPNLTQLSHLSLFLSHSEKNAMKIGSVLFVIGVLWGSYNFVIDHRVEVPAIGGTFIEGLVGQPIHLTPVHSSLRETDDAIVGLVYSGLMRRQPNAKFENDLAQSITASEDKKTYTVVLKNDILFHDGVSLTAEDVAFTFDLLQNEKTRSPLREVFVPIKVKVIDVRTIAITLPSTTSYFDRVMTIGIMPKHLWEKVAPGDIKTTAQNLHPIGSGPYRFEELITMGSRITALRLTRNTAFYRNPGHIKEIEFRFHDSYAESVEAFRKQESDAIGPLSANDNDAQNNTFSSIYTFHLPEFTGIFFNQIAHSALADATVRDALYRAIDRQRLVENVLHNQAQIAVSPLPHGSRISNNEDDAYDPANAASTLDKRGFVRIDIEEYITASSKEKLKKFTEAYKKEHSAIPTEEELHQQETKLHAEVRAGVDPTQPFLRKKSGAYLEINITTPDTKDTKAVAEFIAESWRSIGVLVHIIPVQSEELQSLVATHHYEALLTGVVQSAGDDPYPLWYNASSDSSPALARFQDASFDALLTEIHKTDNEDSRLEKLEKFESYIMQKKPAIILFNPTFDYAISKKIKGVEGGEIITTSNRFAGITNWYIRVGHKWKW